MSILYAIGLLQTFVFNTTWTFSPRGESRLTFLRYGTIYLVGFCINFFALLLLVDTFGLPHQAVQALTILSLALILFTMQKLWVFPATVLPVRDSPPSHHDP